MATYFCTRKAILVHRSAATMLGGKSGLQRVPYLVKSEGHKWVTACGQIVLQKFKLPQGNLRKR
jgi:hypothetical protein